MGAPTGAFQSCFIDSTGTRIVLYFDPPTGESWDLTQTITENDGFGVPPTVTVTQPQAWTTGASTPYQSISVTPDGRLKLVAPLTGTAQIARVATLSLGEAWITVGANVTGAASVSVPNRSRASAAKIRLVNVYAGSLGRR